MIKYANLKGYKNLGEVQIFSHLYQFIESDKDRPMIILINAYESDAKIFKGFLYNLTSTYKSISITDEELNTLETYIGKATQVELLDFIKGTIIENQFKEFTQIKD